MTRLGYDVYRDKLNTPHFMAKLPCVQGLKGLDVGCGEGHNTRQVAHAGGQMTGVDLAATFIQHAQQQEANVPLGIIYRQADACALPFADASFDFATSFMALMDVAYLDRALAEIYRVLRPGGFLQFSILHPCFAPPLRQTLRNDQGEVYAVTISDYYVESDGSIEEWSFGAAERAGEPKQASFRVPRFHHSLTNWMTLSLDLGFQLEALWEPKASVEEAEACPDIADTRVVPLFIHMRLRKPTR